jgi:hypothetical protein
MAVLNLLSRTSSVSAARLVAAGADFDDLRVLAAHGLIAGFVGEREIDIVEAHEKVIRQAKISIAGGGKGWVKTDPANVALHVIHGRPAGIPLATALTDTSADVLLALADDGLVVIKTVDDGTPHSRWAWSFVIKNPRLFLVALTSIGRRAIAA